MAEKYKVVEYPTYIASDTIGDLKSEEMPREKVLRHTARSEYVSDADLLAIILGSGVKGHDVISLSNEIMRRVGGNLARLSSYDHKHLIAEFKGIGEAQALKLEAALELGRRRHDYKRQNRRQAIRNSRDMADLFFNDLLDKPKEELHVAYLTRALHVIAKQCMSAGIENAVLAEPREIIRMGINLQAAFIVLCHNHPSGNVSPSRADRELTEKVRLGASYFDMTLLDHIILVDNPDLYFSFRDENII